MNVNDLKLLKKYKLQNLVEIFQTGEFYYGKGMIYVSKTNTLILTSKYTKDVLYQDEIKNGKIYYTGMGQTGDQTLTFGNKRLANAKRDNTDVHLFLVYKYGEFTYYGKASLDEPYYMQDEPDRNGNARKVYKFPLTFLENIIPLSTAQMATTIGAGPIPVVQVVGACIKNGDKYLVAQRSAKQGMEDKWEFPGGKIEKGETPEEALAREIQEELGMTIRVSSYVDTSKHYDPVKERYICLSVYNAEIVEGEPIKKEHKALEWKTIDELENLDWADNDIPIAQTIIDSAPKRIVGKLDFTYKEGKRKTPRPSEIKRACQDYEKSQRRKAKAGDEAELAVIEYERKHLVDDLLRPDLIPHIVQVSKISSDYGYDIQSVDIIDGRLTEIHIEVKSATLSGDNIKFFISQAELRNYATDDNYRIYALIRFGNNYKLHIIKKEEFLSDGRYISPITYEVSIPVEEF